MAIGGGASPSWEAQIVDGVLKLNRQTLRLNVVSDLDTAVHRLLAGETIFLSARADVVNAVRRTVEMTHGKQATHPAQNV